MSLHNVSKLMFACYITDVDVFVQSVVHILALFAKKSSPSSSSTQKLDGNYND